MGGGGGGVSPGKASCDLLHKNVVWSWYVWLFILVNYLIVYVPPDKIGRRVVPLEKLSYFVCYKIKTFSATFSIPYFFEGGLKYNYFCLLGLANYYLMKKMRQNVAQAITWIFFFGNSKLHFRNTNCQYCRIRALIVHILYKLWWNRGIFPLRGIKPISRFWIFSI